MALAIVGRPPAPVTARRLREVVDGAARALGLSGSEVSLRFAGDRAVRAANRRFRGVDRPTDVLSFPSGDPPAPGAFLGDLLVSRDRARIQARRSGLGVAREVEELVLHGVLHLAGFDHERDSGEMDALELRLRRRLLDRRQGR